MSFVYDKEFYNNQSAEIVVPIIINLFSPKSIIDVGCGLGNWLSVFKKHGISDILGVDGEWINGENIEIETGNILIYDLTTPLNLNRKFDLAISLEVAEHIDEKFTDVFIESLTSASDTIVFSAAVPFQGGHNHINLQWQSYWIEKFRLQGYACYDLIRPEIWTNPNVFYWYKQNMLVFSKIKLNLQKNDKVISNVVHPEFYIEKINELENLKTQITNYKEGLGGVKNSLKTFIKSIKNKISK